MVKVCWFQQPFFQQYVYLFSYTIQFTCKSQRMTWIVNILAGQLYLRVYSRECPYLSYCVYWCIVVMYMKWASQKSTYWIRKMFSVLVEYISLKNCFHSVSFVFKIKFIKTRIRHSYNLYLSLHKLVSEMIGPTANLRVLHYTSFIDFASKI